MTLSQDILKSSEGYCIKIILKWPMDIVPKLMFGECIKNLTALSVLNLLTILKLENTTFVL